MNKEKIIEKAKELCKELTKTYDESHNYDHHLRVYENVKKIINSLIEENEIKENEIKENEIEEIKIICSIASLLHDTIDHKYKETYEYNKNKLEEFLSQFEFSNKVKLIINNMSYSKELKEGLPKFDEKLLLMRNIVSDSDKLDALGKIGLIRCEEYTKMVLRKNNNSEVVNSEVVNSEVVKHYNEKLISLDNYIITKKGKELAVPLKEEMSIFIEKYNH